MIVVADTSPICYLILMGRVDLLSSLFGSIYIPQAVYEELNHQKSPQAVKEWAACLPKWVNVMPSTGISISSLSHLHKGEYEVITLAEKMKADIVIIDEKAGRNSAKERNIKVTGLVGMMKIASSKGLVDVNVMIEELKATNFRISQNLLELLVMQCKQNDNY
ncbi:MAG: DUF3368 domain-containing protein [Halothece sp.]